MKKKKRNFANSIIVFCLIFTLSCQTMPVKVSQDDDNYLLRLRENLPPDEETLTELKEASELAKSFRQELITKGITNFSFNDWQIANTLYNETVRQEKNDTIRETQESIARYNLTAVVLETLYLTAINETPMGGGVESYEDEDLYWYFDDIETGTVIPPPNSIILLSQTQETQEIPLPVPAEPVTEEDREPGKGLFIPDRPSRKERRAAIAAERPESDAETPQIAATMPTSLAPIVMSTTPEPAPVTQTLTSTDTAPEPVVQTPAAQEIPSSQASHLPAQYKVISWQLYGDCLWNIAELIYNDPRKWRILYEANKHKMPEPDNPDLIEPGMILDIPSIAGEYRSGMWDITMGRPGRKEEE